ncbi:LOW QUALITY PROTEIN: bifunctional glutamate/proline--tRNA ligase [Bombus pyrosoma]|uniref:LOW QUALITY PROTEIN: bifunctional glutamate/proline--tRNA ligase n=1 Tax=Bombus pyrosoma TaxID=396416 RepID=UPI001CB97236|nr:LOW QUALITY PROTEIN: bifunctional glutamate/proline--tRNA ligase [Bombus pyrosoma]
MTYKVIVDSKNPPTDALIVLEVINSQNKEKIEIVWCNDWKDDGNIQLTDSQNKILGKRSSDVSRYFARTTCTDLYGGVNPREKTEVDHWLSFAIGPLEFYPLKEDALSYLDNILMTNTWLVSKKLTIADIHVFCTLVDKKFLTQFEKKFINITRWYKQMLSLSTVTKALLLVKKNAKLSLHNNVQSEKTINKQTGQRKQEGKFIDLPGAEMGKVIVRFPPEASGYLHIGHAKAALLNQYYAQTFQGQFIMRFDDTNPAKENVEFEKAILEDLELLQIKPDRFTHSSDYFDLMLEYCTKLIKDGKAYVDNTPADIMKEQRDQKLMSSNRNNSIEQNLELWNEMQQGTVKGQECCVRAKIDYQSTNGCLRDPTIYRCKPEPHPRTGTKYKVYPIYDFACPIVDAIENVTHTLRTTEYHDRDVQFYWIIDALGLRRPYIWEYSRLNMTHTVLSKRKLTWFVDQGLVDGWDDPRFPTVRGILRRGMTVEGLKQFIIAQGSSKSVVFMEWDKIWAFNKKVIDPVATRYTALEYNKIVPVHIDDAKEEWLTVQNHPKDTSKGTKQVLVGSQVYIERDDANLLTEGQNATFINWGNILIKKIEREDDVIKRVVAQLNLENKDYKSTLKITWLSIPSDKNHDVSKVNLIPCYAVYFDHIISKSILGKDDDYKDFIAKNTRTEIQMLGEVALKHVEKGEIIQLQRKGFFRCDVSYAPVSPFSSREQPLILFHIPDGHTTNITKSIPTGNIPASVKEISQKNKQTLDANLINKKIVVQLEETGTPGTTLNKSQMISDENKLSENTLSENIIQQESRIKELQLKINQEMQRLSNLKTEYKNKTGNEWTGVKNQNITKDILIETHAVRLYNEIKKQGDKVRQLKSLKAEKSVIDEEVKKLLALKSDYKSVTGQDWKPSTIPTTDVTNTDENSAAKISESIQKQGDKVRQLKSSKAERSVIDEEVKKLLALKSDYKSVTGQDWKPSTIPTTDVTNTDENSAAKISESIQKQGDKVRQLKSLKAEKSVIDEEVKKLLALKSDYKSVTGQDWKPSTIPTTDVTNTDENSTDKMSDGIQNQGNKVKKLREIKAVKSIIDKEVKVLLDLKNNYKAHTGQECKSIPDMSKKKKEDVSKREKQNTSNKEISKNESMKDVDIGKTRLGLEAGKEENFFEWYSQIITKSGMIEYYDVSGCYVYRPWSFAVWKIIKEYIDKEITQMGVQECYFPMFVTRTVLEKEKKHIADFAPEVAWVTKCGESDLAEPIAIRPTSETVMYPAYAKWLKSDTELPLKLNQWNNVVRWEFKDPKPFLRTREFLWQEGHSAFATKAEADEEVMIILDLYARVYEELLAVPVVKGRKTEKEKFAGGDYTTTVEAFISTSGRAIQGATSHHLGQNFSKMFNIQVENAVEGNEKTFVYQNSWGLTTRTIGVMIMVHGDDKGLVLPPNVACIQAIIVPCGITASTTPQQRELLFSECNKLLGELSKDSLRVKADYRSNRTPGWKFNHWELKGVPVRIEVGPKDLNKNQVTFVRRDNSERIFAKRPDVVTALHTLLTNIQADMLSKAKKNLNEHIKRADNWNEFCSYLNEKNILLSPFCGESSCEDKIKRDSAREDTGGEIGTLSMGAKSLCIPFEQPPSSASFDKQTCIHPDCQNKPQFYTLFGRSY